MIKRPEHKSKLRRYWLFIVERRASFAFTVGSIAYGLYHFFNHNVLINTDAYHILGNVFGYIGGRHFGLIFIILGLFKLYGLFADKAIFKIPMYFALLALWIVLGICFFISFLFGGQNASWIYAFIISALSTSILSTNAVVIKEED